ncbi:hypothetical protein FC89_GL001332 [Liquorilactobacillus ghanensis DSM 18630]|uniref:Uncharacterized protein n=1 Tax=Liquorilactobacillus ghanensis DSM 18630 TaxID=1423750 RepID=A0A0R1VVN7_9LACO|nr:hypothetical protein FC89_GL001332 [Liquorilactobacillus ghanensis DSM 18630]
MQLTNFLKYSNLQIKNGTGQNIILPRFRFFIWKNYLLVQAIIPFLLDKLLPKFSYVIR